MRHQAGATQTPSSRQDIRWLGVGKWLEEAHHASCMSSSSSVLLGRRHSTGWPQIQDIVSDALKDSTTCQQGEQRKQGQVLPPFLFLFLSDATPLLRHHQLSGSSGSGSSAQAQSGFLPFRACACARTRSPSLLKKTPTSNLPQTLVWQSHRTAGHWFNLESRASESHGPLRRPED